MNRKWIKSHPCHKHYLEVGPAEKRKRTVGNLTKCMGPPDDDEDASTDDEELLKDKKLIFNDRKKSDSKKKVEVE